MYPSFLIGMKSKILSRRAGLLCLFAVAADVFLFTGREAFAQAPSRAEEALAKIAENPDRAANNMHSYEFHPLSDTKTPKGYKAFYVSHYGRHGSRYEQSSSFSRAALEGFRKADSLSMLTPEGKVLYDQVRAITEEHEGMEGALTPRGGREHQQLAERMVSRYPSVFNQKDRREVSAFSSTVQRCIISMANFTGAMGREEPDLTFTYTTGSRYMPYLSPSIKFSRSLFSRLGQKGPEFDWSRFMAQIVKDPAGCGEAIPDAESFVRSIYSAGGLCQDLDFLGIDIFRKYFTPEELTYLWQRQNDTIYGLWGNSMENGDSVRAAIKPLLKDFVEKADVAILEGSHRCADLRFGHDTGVLPLAAILGIDDPQGRRYSVSDAHDYWFAHERVPMATNLQMIFYHNKKGDVIAKVLYNEQEVCFKALEPLSGPYYPWKTLRTWFLSLCQ